MDPFISLDGRNAVQRHLLKSEPEDECCSCLLLLWPGSLELVMGRGFLEPCLWDDSSPALEIRFGSLKLISVCVT